MKIWRFSSPLKKEEIIKKSKKLGFIPIRIHLVHSLEELELAHFLAKKSFNNRKNLAKIFELEFLLWLLGKKDIRQALEKNDFSPKDFFLISFNNLKKQMILRELEAKEKPLSLEKKANNIRLENISLGRII